MPLKLLWIVGGSMKHVGHERVRGGKAVVGGTTAVLRFAL